MSGRHKEFPPLPQRQVAISTEHPTQQFNGSVWQRHPTNTIQLRQPDRDESYKQVRNVGTQTTYEEVGIQTDATITPPSNDSNNNAIINNPEVFFQKLKNFIIEIMSGNFHKESSSAQDPLLDSAI